MTIASRNGEQTEHRQATPSSSFCCSWPALNWCIVEDLQKYTFLWSSLPVVHLSNIISRFVRFREVQNFRSPRMGSISKFVIKRRSINFKSQAKKKPRRRGWEYNHQQRLCVFLKLVALHRKLMQQLHRPT